MLVGWFETSRRRSIDKSPQTFDFSRIIGEAHTASLGTRSTADAKMVDDPKRGRMNARRAYRAEREPGCAGGGSQAITKDDSWFLVLRFCFVSLHAQV